MFSCANPIFRKTAMLDADCERPPKLYRYAEHQSLERSLTLGEFRLQPAAEEKTASPQILPFQSSAARAMPASAYLTLSLSKTWDVQLFDAFPDADCCLIIHDPEQFGERIHRAATKMLPTWAGIDAAISYGAPSPLGRAFSKNRQHANQQEWLFAWRPTQPAKALQSIVIQIGSIEEFAELRGKIG
jgi:hypothetical protein